MKNKRFEKLDKATENFQKSKSIVAHRKAIEIFLAEIGLKSEFLRSLKKDGSDISEFFISFRLANKHKDIPQIERENMVEISKNADRLLKNKQYKSFFDSVFELILQHICDFLRLSDRKDFKELDTNDLYRKHLLPSEIFMQFFILEMLAKDKRFDWKRDPKIIKQTMVCAGVCFGDIYEFLHYESLGKEKEKK